MEANGETAGSGPEGNAAKEIKKNARLVTATNEEEGVRKVLEKFL